MLRLRVMKSILVGQLQEEWKNKMRGEHLVVRDDGWSYQWRGSSVSGEGRTENGWIKQPGVERNIMERGGATGFYRRGLKMASEKRVGNSVQRWSVESS